MKRNDLLLIFPSLSLLTLLLCLISGILKSAPDFLNLVKLIVLFLAPGWYLTRIIGEAIELKVDEIIVLDIVISTIITTFVSIYLSFITQITETTFIVSLLIVTFVSGLICSPRLFNTNKLRKKVTISNTLKLGMGLLISFFIGFLLVTRVIPTNYWTGWDPWVNTPVAQVILHEGLNPLELSTRYQVSIDISGFYYFLTSVRVFTGIDLYTINRFGGPILAGIASVITYLIVKRLESKGAGLLSSFFLPLNLFFIKRFSMTIRENFAYIFFLAILFLLVVRKQKYRRDWASRLGYLFLIGLLLGTLFISHLLTLIITYSIIFLELVFFLLKDKKAYTAELILAFILSLLFVTPYIQILIPAFSWIIRNQILTKFDLRIFIILSFSIIVTLISYKKLKRKNFSKKRIRIGFLIVGIVFLIGTFNSILFPKTFSVLGSYNPTIRLDMFATSILLLAVLGVISTFWSSVQIDVLFLSLVIVLFMNFPNVNVAFPVFRLVIYISWLVSYLAAKSLNFIYDLFYFKFELSTCLLFLNRLFKNKKMILLIPGIFLLILSPIIVTDFAAAEKRYSYHIQEDVDSTLDFITLLKKNDVVVPQSWTQNILRYVNIDIDKVIHDETLFSSNTIENFSQIILSKHSNATRIFIFMIQRWIGNENYPVPSLELLGKHGEKYRLGSIAYYVIYLGARKYSILYYSSFRI